MRPPLFHLSYIPLTRIPGLARYLSCYACHYPTLRKFCLFCEEVLPSVTMVNECAGNCIRFSTSRSRSNLFLLRAHPQKRKEDMKCKRKQKLLISSPYKVHHALQYHSITFCKKSCPPHFQESKHISQFFNVSFNKITFLPAFCILRHITHFCGKLIQVLFQCCKHFSFALFRFT